MASTDDRNRAAPTRLAAHAAFELERFDWEGPDRLDVSGKFVGVGDALEDEPEIVVRGAHEVHRLPVVPESVAGAPEEGRRWRAAFAWQAAPTPFDSAELIIGDIAVELPPPATRRSRFWPTKLEARRLGAGHAPAPDAAGVERGARTEADVVAGFAGDRLRLETELISARQEICDVRAALHRAEQDVERARADLEAERERHAADADRFREALASLTDSAEDTLAAEESAVQQLRADLREAHDALAAKGAALDDLRGQLEAATTAWEDAESAARAEVDELHERVAALTDAGEEVERLRADLERTRERAAAAEHGLEKVQGAGEEARADAERLLGRIDAIREALREEPERQ